MENFKDIINGYEVVLDKEFFDREVFFWLANKYREKYFVRFQPYGKAERQVKLTLMNNGDNVLSKETMKHIIAEMEQEQFQIDILNRTREIRDDVYEKAFSPLKGKV